MMKRYFIFLLCLLILIKFSSCSNGRVEAIQVVVFDLNDFEKTDTIIIADRDTCKLIGELFERMIIADVKFPSIYQVTLVRKDEKKVYYTNGRFVRFGKQSFKLPAGNGLDVFERQLKVKN